MTRTRAHQVRWSKVGTVIATVIATGVGVSTGCSESKTSDDGKPADIAIEAGVSWNDAAVPSNLTATQACAKYMQATCERKNECGLGTEDCVKSLVNCPDSMFSAGSTREVESTWQCAFVMRQRGCQDVYLSKNPACVTTGTRKAGEPCISSSQCESLACNGSATTCGTCLRRAAKGAD